MLYRTGVVLDQMDDLDMYETLASGLRGGVCHVSHKHAKANDKYMKDFNVEKLYIS